MTSPSLTNAARAAGDIAMRYFRKIPKVWEKPGEGPVTEADIAVNDMLIDTPARRASQLWLAVRRNPRYRRTARL